MSARFQPGELIDLTIRGARVSDKHVQDKYLFLSVGEETFHLPVRLLARANVQRVAPAEWPPQVGDVWEDATGVQWFTRYYEGEPYFVSTAGGHDDASGVLDSVGPMTLVYRKGWTPTLAAVPRGGEVAGPSAGPATAPDFELGPLAQPATGQWWRDRQDGVLIRLGAPDAGKKGWDYTILREPEQVDAYWISKRNLLDGWQLLVLDPASGKHFDPSSGAERFGFYAEDALAALSDEAIDGALVDLAQALDANPELLADEPDPDARDPWGNADCRCKGRPHYRGTAGCIVAPATDPGEVDR